MFNVDEHILNILLGIKKPASCGLFNYLNLILIQSIFQAFTGLEARHLGCFDFQSSACAWVATRTCSAFADTESTKANQSHSIALFEGLLDSLNDRSERTCCSCFRNVRFTSNVLNQFGLVHGLVPIVNLGTSNADLGSLLKLFKK